MKNPLIQVLSVKPFSYLLLSEIFSQISMNLFNFILLIVAFTLVHSNTGVAGVVLSFTIPSLFFGLLAGVLVDKLNKKNVLFWSNLSRGILILPLIFLSDNPNYSSSCPQKTSSFGKRTF
jgi:MFS family permease